jgi:hypothetical protein
MFEISVGKREARLEGVRLEWLSRSLVEETSKGLIFEAKMAQGCKQDPAVGQAREQG